MSTNRIKPNQIIVTLEVNKFGKKVEEKFRIGAVIQGSINTSYVSIKRVHKVGVIYYSLKGFRVEKRTGNWSSSDVGIATQLAKKYKDKLFPELKVLDEQFVRR
jgi:hypothetical protein